MNIVLPVHATRDAWETVASWIEAHGQAAMATVVSTWGSAPVPAGGHLVVTSDDRFEGSVSGGCVEADVIAEAADVMATGKPKLLEFGVSEETAWRAGLPCGGKISVLVEPFTRADADHVAEIIEARRARRTVLRTTRVGDGRRQLYSSKAGTPSELAGFISSGVVGTVEAADGPLVVQPIVPPLRVIVAGATHISQVFTELARQVGYQVTVVDPRAAFLTQERFAQTPSVSEWPEAAFGALGLDDRTAVVALTHAAHIDDEALAAALRSPACYVGALGSRTTHAKRLERLRADGFGEEQLKRIRAPIGLAIGAKGPAEIAVSILAEIIQVTRSAN